MIGWLSQWQLPMCPTITAFILPFSTHEGDRRVSWCWRGSWDCPHVTSHFRGNMTSTKAMRYSKEMRKISFEGSYWGISVIGVGKGRALHLFQVFPPTLLSHCLCLATSKRTDLLLLLCPGSEWGVFDQRRHIKWKVTDAQFCLTPEVLLFPKWFYSKIMVSITHN